MEIDLERLEQLANEPVLNMDELITLTYAVPDLIKRIRELERQRNWLAERIHRKGTVMYGKYPPTTKGWIKAAQEKTAKEAGE